MASTFEKVMSQRGAAAVLLNADPPEHRRQRKAVNPAFKPSKIRALEPMITEVTDRLLDEVGEHIDLVCRELVSEHALQIEDDLVVEEGESGILCPPAGQSEADVEPGGAPQPRGEAADLGHEPGEEMRPYAEIVQAPPELKFERLYGDRTMRFLRSYKVQATWRLDAEQRGTIVTVLPEKVSGFADILFTPAGEVRYDRCYINDDAFLYYEPSEADNCKTHYGELEQLLTTPEMTYFLEQNNLTY